MRAHSHDSTLREGASPPSPNFTERESNCAQAALSDFRRSGCGVWAPRAAGEKYDMYCVFSMDFGEGMLTRAILFAFYDGEEHSKVAIKGEKGARAEARRLGYKEISDE